MKTNKYDKLLKILIEIGNYSISADYICKEMRVSRNELDNILGYIHHKKGFVKHDGSNVFIPLDKHDLAKEFLQDGGFSKEERNKKWDRIIDRAKTIFALVGIIEVVIRLYYLLS